MNRQLQFKQFWLVITCISAVISFSEASLASGQALVTATEAFVRQEVTARYPAAERVEIHIKAPDARLPLKNCVEPTLTLHGSNRLGARLLVKADCGQSTVQYLAVELAVFQQIVVAERNLSRNTLINLTDVRLTDANILTQHRAVFTDAAEVTGKMLKRSISAGTVLTNGMLKTPALVDRGDSVVIVASKGGLVVRMPGTAMAKGGLGEQITVRNTASKRVVKGWIRGPGEVHVPM